MQDSGFTIRSMAERCGMTAHTLRYYERVGLIQPVGRARNGHRRYSEADAAWLNFLHCMRGTNMPIREMQRYAAMREMVITEAKMAVDVFGRPECQKYLDAPRFAALVSEAKMQAMD